MFTLHRTKSSGIFIKTRPRSNYVCGLPVCFQKEHPYSVMRLSSKNSSHGYLSWSSPNIRLWNVLLFLDTSKERWLRWCRSLPPPCSKIRFVFFHDDSSKLCSPKTFIKPTDALRRCLSKEKIRNACRKPKRKVLFFSCWWAWSIRLAAATFYTPKRVYTAYMLLVAARACKISLVACTCSPP